MAFKPVLKQRTVKCYNVFELTRGFFKYSNRLSIFGRRRIIPCKENNEEHPPCNFVTRALRKRVRWEILSNLAIRNKNESTTSSNADHQPSNLFSDGRQARWWLVNLLLQVPTTNTESPIHHDHAGLYREFSNSYESDGSTALTV